MTKFRLNKRNLWSILLVLAIGLSVYLITKIPLEDYVGELNLPIFGDIEPERLQFMFAIGGEGSSGEYKLSEPLGIDIAVNGDIFVADTGDNLVKIFDQNGKFKKSFGNQRFFNLPADVALTNTEVLVADTRNSRIQVFSQQGTFLRTFAGPELGKKIGAWLPQAIYLAPNGEVYVSDVFYHRVLVFNQKGTYLRQFGLPGLGAGQLQYPNGIAVSKTGQVFVSDSNNGRIQIFDAVGKFQGTLSYQGQAFGLSMPRGIACDVDEMLYVAETFGHNIRTMEVTNNNVEETTVIGKRGTQANEMNFPNDLAVRGDRLCVTDRANNRVLVYQIIR